MGLVLQYNQEFHEPATSADLRRMIDDFRASDPEAAFWLLDKAEPLLNLLTSGDRACLCYEPTLTWSKNPQPTDEDEMVPFQLENGQEDDIPAECVIDVGPAIDAFVEFFETGKLSRRIRWVEQD